jgi:hypothetical protein
MACEVHVELCFIRIWRLGHVYLDAVRGAWRKLAPHHRVLYYLDAFEQRLNVFLGLLYVRPPLSSASRYVRPMPYLSRICSSPQWRRQLRAKDSSRFFSAADPLQRSATCRRSLLAGLGHAAELRRSQGHRGCYRSVAKSLVAALAPDAFTLAGSRGNRTETAAVLGSHEGDLMPS